MKIRAHNKEFSHFTNEIAELPVGKAFLVTAIQNEIVRVKQMIMDGKYPERTLISKEAMLTTALSAEVLVDKYFSK